MFVSYFIGEREKEKGLSINLRIITASWDHILIEIKIKMKQMKLMFGFLLLLLNSLILLLCEFQWIHHFLIDNGRIIFSNFGPIDC